MTEIEKCWSFESWFTQVMISNINYPKTVDAGKSFVVRTRISDNSTFGCILVDRYFKLQIKSLTANKYIWESLQFKLCKDESIEVAADLTMGSADETLSLEVCFIKTAAPNTLQDKKEIIIRAAASGNPATPPEDELPSTQTGTNWTTVILYAAGIAAAAYIAATYIGMRKKET